MRNAVEGHLVNFKYLAEFNDYEDHVWYGGAMTVISYNAYSDTPSKKECDKICREKSGRAVTWQTTNYLHMTKPKKK